MNFDDPQVQQRIEQELRAQKAQEFRTGLMDELVQDDDIRIVMDDLYQTNLENVETISLDIPED